MHVIILAYCARLRPPAARPKTPSLCTHTHTDEHAGTSCATFSQAYIGTETPYNIFKQTYTHTSILYTVVISLYSKHITRSRNNTHFAHTRRSGVDDRSTQAGMEYNIVGRVLRQCTL